MCSSMVLIAAIDFFSKVVSALEVDENLKFTISALIYKVAQKNTHVFNTETTLPLTPAI